jgi:DNA-binding MarR family transcriptional regulator
MSLAERKDGRDEIGRKVIEFTEQDIREAARLLALIANAGSSRLEELLRAPQRGAANNHVDRDVLLARIRRHLSNRRLRTSYLNRAIFGEPAWDMLLVLYITESAGGRQSVRRLADWVGTPVSTTLRWINYLAKERLVQKEAHPNDRRMVFVTLLDKGRELLESYFSSIAE